MRRADRRLLSSVIAIIGGSSQEVPRVPSILVRGLDESVKAQLAAQARQNGRSMEAEAREILTRAARRPNIGVALLRAAERLEGVDVLPVPERTEPARAVDFG
jgi:plasmid stability protein